MKVILVLFLMGTSVHWHHSFSTAEEASLWLAANGIPDSSLCAFNPCETRSYEFDLDKNTINKVTLPEVKVMYEKIRGGK